MTSASLGRRSRGSAPNTYGVLLTRGVRGTYVYACDAGVRERLRAHRKTAWPIAWLAIWSTRKR
ncbi:DNA/RNA helicase domain-containing protein [Microbacterium gorillae]|uniref:DNA/RNA helicase domain-containing protein n=1 Tax=Microbacterium gorillae TaxID=1231063 RepID=UPI00114246AD|nr:DNA/RNA helicase domain-containing protein [Microbacterium gorillae]